MIASTVCYFRKSDVHRATAPRSNTQPSPCRSRSPTHAPRHEGADDQRMPCKPTCRTGEGRALLEAFLTVPVHVTSFSTSQFHVGNNSSVLYILYQELKKSLQLLKQRTRPAGRISRIGSPKSVKSMRGKRFWFYERSCRKSSCQ